MSNIGISLGGFIACVRPYLPSDAHIRQRTVEGGMGDEAIAGELRENRFYYFDPDACQAVFHGIEDIAMEEANGTLFSLFPTFAGFEAQRERYGHLAATIDQVAVAGSGRIPRPLNRVRFKAAPRPGLAEYQMISFEARRTSLLFISRTARVSGSEPEKGASVGFFTFSPRLARRIRDEVTAVFAGKTTDLREFERLLAVDQAARQIELDLARQREAVERAMLGLREGTSPKLAGQAATELAKGALRMNEWKDRLSAMMGRPERR